MTRHDHLAYFCRLRILKKLLSGDKIKSYSDVYDEIIFIYSVLIKSKVSFTLEDLDYNFFNHSKNTDINELLTYFPKEYFLGLINNLKKIYYLNNTFSSYYNNLSATFSNRDSTLSIKKGNLTCFFVISKSLIRYIAYSVGSNNYLIDDKVIFTLTEFDDFIKHISEYHSLDKSVLDMIFIS